MNGSLAHSIPHRPLDMLLCSKANSGGISEVLKKSVPGIHLLSNSSVGSLSNLQYPCICGIFLAGHCGMPLAPSSAPRPSTNTARSCCLLCILDLAPSLERIPGSFNSHRPLDMQQSTELEIDDLVLILPLRRNLKPARLCDISPGFH